MDRYGIGGLQTGLVSTGRRSRTNITSLPATRVISFRGELLNDVAITAHDHLIEKEVEPVDAHFAQDGLVLAEPYVSLLSDGRVEEPSVRSLEFCE